MPRSETTREPLYATVEIWSAGVRPTISARRRAKIPIGLGDGLWSNEAPGVEEKIRKHRRGNPIQPHAKPSTAPLVAEGLGIGRNERIEIGGRCFQAHDVGRVRERSEDLVAHSEIRAPEM